MATTPDEFEPKQPSIARRIFDGAVSPVSDSNLRQRVLFIAAAAACVAAPFPFSSIVAGAVVALAYDRKR